MGKVSYRKTLIREAQQWIAYSMLNDDDKGLEDAILFYGLLLEHRFVNRMPYIVRDNDFYTKRFLSYSDSVFLQKFRTSRKSHRAVTRLIENHPVFQNNSNNPQVHPGWQLAVALNRFGHYGNRMNVGEVSADFDISTGSVVKYTERVMTALVDLASDWIKWPDESRRTELSQVMREEGFPGCIGFIDGTTIPLSQKPAMQGAAYFDRKSRYGAL